MLIKTSKASCLITNSFDNFMLRSFEFSYLWFCNVSESTWNAKMLWCLSTYLKWNSFLCCRQDMFLQADCISLNYTMTRDPLMCVTTNSLDNFATRSSEFSYLVLQSIRDCLQLERVHMLTCPERESKLLPCYNEKFGVFISLVLEGVRIIRLE